jgi:hypothetical protein
LPLVSADPLGSLLPHSDPFREPGQVGTCGDEQRGRERLGLPLIPVFPGVEAKGYPGPFREQVAATVRDLLQLGDRARRPAVSGSRTGPRCRRAGRS